MSVQIAKQPLAGRPLTRRLFTVDEYHRMAESGILTEDDRVELIHGEIITMSPIGNRHVVCVNRLNMLLAPLLAKKAIVSIQNSLRIDIHSEPEPDVVLFRHRDDFYANQLPEMQDVLLVIEVSDTTLKYDRKVKLPLYANAGIREAWIVNLAEETLEVYTNPANGKYADKQMLKSNDAIALMNTSVAVKEILG